MSNYYVIGDNAPVPDLSGTPYAGYSVVNQTEISKYTGSHDLHAGDNVVLSGSTSGTVYLHPRTGPEGGSSGEKVDVTVLDNANTLNVDFTAGGGVHHLSPTVNVLGQSPNTTISGSGTTELTVNVADNATVGDITGTSGHNTITTGDHSTVGFIWTGSSDDTIHIGNGARAGDITAGNGSDGITLGNGAHVGKIALGSGGSMGDTVTGGNDVTTGGITQSVSESDSSVTLGDRATINGDVNLEAGLDKLVVGDGSVVNGSITMGSDGSARDADILTIGKGSKVTSYINTNNGDDTVVVGGNTTLLGGWNAINTQMGDDTVIIGKGVVAPNPIFTGQESDRVIILGDGNYTVDMGAVAPNSDVVEWNYAPGTEMEFNKMMTEKGYEYDTEKGLWYHSVNHGTALGGVNITNNEYIRGVTCFTPGTMIETDRGPVAVETLVVGDRVMTRDRGAQPIRWINHRTISAAELALSPETRPVRIAAGALGHGLPVADLTVSHWHRMLVRSTLAAEIAGSDEVLVAACNLTDLPGVEQVNDGQPVTYIHFMCDQHEVVTANGAPTESMNVGLNTAAALSPESCAEILALFPELAHGPHSPVRPPVRGAEGREMVRRHLEAGLALA